MCTPVINSWPSVPPLRRAPHRTFSGLGFRRAVYAKNSGHVICPPDSPVRLPNNGNVCRIDPLPRSKLWSFDPLPYPAPAGFALAILTVANSNSILDDGWDFKVDGITVANYDGGGQTTLNYYAYLPSGASHALSAECVAEQNDNLFTVTLDVDGVRQIDTSISGDGTVGETRDLGTFNT